MRTLVETSATKANCNCESPVLQGPQSGRVLIDGRERLSFASNNYLGLANRREVERAAVHAVEKFGAGAVAARALSGTTLIHEELEHEIAAFKGCEEAIIFSSGYAANAGTIPALVDAHDAVISDELNHGSIIDGCRLSSAKRFIYRHRDMNDLETKLKASSAANKRLIVTDAVFSMNGRIAPLPEIVELARRWGASVMVDEAHATGVLGENGRGCVEYFGMEDEVEFVMGTLGKAIGAVGGYVAASRAHVTCLRRTARTYLLTTAHPPASAAAALEGLRVLQQEPALRERLWRNTARFRDSLVKAGFNTMDSETPIVPILVGGSDMAVEFCRRLFAENIYLTPITCPYVPAGTSRLRAIVSAEHTERDIDYASDIIAQLGREMELV